MFVHLLVWDERYAAEFLGELLAAIFDITTYCEHVILVVPPRVTPEYGESCEDPHRLIVARRVYANCANHQQQQRCREEDNDDAIPIIGGESTRLGELYGPYYISEMIRHPDGCRQLIIGEDADGSAAGVVCLDSAIDVDQLNENFELTPHHGLRKTCEDDETSADVAGVTSELVHSAFARHDQDLSDSTQAHKVAADEPSMEKRRSSSEENGKVSSTHEQIETTARAKVLFQSSVQVDSIDNLRKRDNVPPDTRARSTDLIRPFESKTLYKLHLDRFLNSSAPSSNDSQIMSLSDLSLISDYFDTHFQSRLRETIFSDATFQLFQEGDAPSVIEDNEVTRSRLIHNVLPHPTYHGEINAFVLEIFAARKDERPHWSRDFLEAAFDCFPHLDYCAILLPSFHPYRQYLQHFVRVPLRCNKDFPMMLYVAHRAAFCEEIKCRRGQIRDRKAVEELLLTVPTRQRILADFDLAVDLLQPDLECIVFKCHNTILGFAILCAEKQVDFIRSYYHVEDHVSMQSIRQDEYGRLLHFVLMPIFSAYHRFFFREIARLSELTVIFYRLHHEDESISTRVHSLVSCLSDMIPVNPRRQANYKFPITLENIDNSGTNTEGKKDYDDSDKDRFSLFVISPRLAMMPRTIIDMRIVVVGASDCGVAFAEYLALRSTQNYTQFTNLTLISPHGLPFDNKRSRAEARLLTFRGRFCSEYRRSVAARTWINIVHGTMVAINRREKYATVLSQGNLAYDFLILTCGLQYQKSILRDEKGAQKRGYRLFILWLLNRCIKLYITFALQG
ncbi:cilia- and flagella-associated protein 61-like [Ooceraea biroi]|uniref:cilia- and flagella-associated protein 61-like n=1 Tax=Ooceraea biroi TaxID=2015173 RepID=UPI000F075FA7|nr:cilia- and flagella-associated protein 61-like [Ooceraea biroi]